MNKDHKDPQGLDLTKPRLASYKQKKWKRHQDTVYWVDFQHAQRKGLKFYQTRCDAIILYDTLPAYCISKVVVMESGEIIYEKENVSPRPPPTISFEDDWMCDLDSDVAGSSKDNQRLQPKPKTQLSRTVRPVGGQESTKEIEKDILFGHEDIKHLTRTVRPVGGFKSIQSCVSMPIKIEEEDQTRTERPVGGQESTKVKERDIHFRVPGLSHAVVKQAEHFRVQELVKKDRKSSSSRSTSSQFAAECLQPIQQQFEGDDPRIGQFRVIQVARNFSKSTMFLLSSLLESWNCVAKNSWLTANPEES